MTTWYDGTIQDTSYKGEKKLYLYLYLYLYGTIGYIYRNVLEDARVPDGDVDVTARSLARQELNGELDGSTGGDHGFASSIPVCEFGGRFDPPHAADLHAGDPEVDSGQDTGGAVGSVGAVD